MAEQVVQPSQGVTRREFLNYVWGAAFSLFLAQLGIGVYLYSLPRFREGEFGSDSDFGVLGDILPPADGAPVGYPDIKTWLVNIGPEEAAKGRVRQGLLAIYKVCTHLGCLYKYEPSTDRFECPCHGSKWWLDGTKILEEGPAPRSLDRFVVELKDEAGNVVAQTNENGDPIDLGQLFTDIDSLRVSVKTGQRILGGPPKSIRE